MEAKLLGEMRNYDFKSALTHIKDTIAGLPSPQEGQDRDFDTAYCARAIPEFLQRVNRTGVPIGEIKDGMLDIVDNCIDKLTFSYKCLKTRTLMNSQVNHINISASGVL